MNTQLSVQVDRARTPAEIKQVAEVLRQVDAPQAIQPLARLDRRAPGWLTILLSLVVTLLINLLGWGISLSLTVGGGWLIATTWNRLLRLFYPEWVASWWITWAGLTTLWLWSDERLRGLLNDERFALPHEDFTLLGVVGLSPFRVLAYAMRLGIALSFLTLMFTLPLTAMLVLAQTWTLWWAGEVSAYQSEWLNYGFAAGSLYLVFGLFIFSDWPRGVLRAHSASTKQKLARVLWAALSALGLGLLVGVLSPTNQGLTSLVAGILFFIVFLWFISKQSSTHPFDFSWLKQIKGVALTRRQKVFLGLTLFGLGLMGIGAIITMTVKHWVVVRSLLPITWLNQLREGYRTNVDSQLTGYWALEPWISGLALAGITSLLALVYLTGWGIRLARPFAWPFFGLRQTVENLVERVRARLAVSAAVRHYRQRNQRLAGKHGQLAICRDHLVRFKPQLAHLSYGQRWKYWQCPECQSDAQAFQGIRLIRGVFDQTMSDGLRAEGSRLDINLLHCADKRLPMPRDLNEIKVGYVADPYEMEVFTVAYQDFATRHKTIRLKRIKLKIEPTANSEESIRRLLKRTFRE